jgi:hypothetical protein
MQFEHMELRTTKTHPQFDLSSAKRTYANLGAELCGEQITSPYDLYSVERLRDEQALRQGASFATDVFVFGKGTSPDRHITKVSGLPYWPKGKEWPTTDDGSPCQFLAQFCFLDSRDLVGKLPGDLLLMFVPPGEEDWLSDFDLVRFEWLRLGKQPLIDHLPQGVQPYCQSEWYGVLHRTHDYPAAAEQASELEVDQPYNLAVLNGTKIGGIPHTIQSEANFVTDPDTGLPLFPADYGVESRQFLCQLASIQAAPDVPYPWTNQEKPLSLDFDESGIYGDENECLFGDMGSIYLFMNSAGECVASSECY